tara:strand:- start:1388 stop:1660 length:273 start_codon:yes stop_codon:yes gene_type:complete
MNEIILDMSDMPVGDGGEKLPDLDMCSCSDCDGVFKVSDIDSSFDHHDGWEMPAYTEHYCPTCKDGGCIDSYFYSKKLEEHLNSGAMRNE